MDDNSDTAVSTTAPDDPSRALRQALARAVAREVKDRRVLQAMERVPRHLFMPGESLSRAYLDAPAVIGFGQTISQPTVVGVMTEALELRGADRVLEIGTGSGYQAAVLSVLAYEVYTVEVVEPLAERARARLARLGYDNVHVRAGDGYLGWRRYAPFDRILLTAAPGELPRALIDQLCDGGVLVGPVGSSEWDQRLVRGRKLGSHFVCEDLGPVRFVPMVADGPVAEV